MVGFHLNRVAWMKQHSPAEDLLHGSDCGGWGESRGRLCRLRCLGAQGGGSQWMSNGHRAGSHVVLQMMDVLILSKNDRFYLWCWFVHSSYLRVIPMAESESGTGRSASRSFAKTWRFAFSSEIPCMTHWGSKFLCLTTVAHPTKTSSIQQVHAHNLPGYTLAVECHRRCWHWLGELVSGPELQNNTTRVVSCCFGRKTGKSYWTNSNFTDFLGSELLNAQSFSACSIAQLGQLQRSPATGFRDEHWTKTPGFSAKTMHFIICSINHDENTPS